VLKRNTPINVVNNSITILNMEEYSQFSFSFTEGVLVLLHAQS